MNEKPMTEQEIQEQREFAKETEKEEALASIESIWYVGNRVSCGCGFWGSFSLLHHRNPKLMVKAWVDALRESGYSDKQIVCYGDWSDGRHIGGNITPGMTYEKFKAMVKSNARDITKFDPCEGYERMKQWEAHLRF